MIQQEKILEGTWEEIKRNDRELTGKQVRLLILASDIEREDSLSLEESERLLDELAALGQGLPPAPEETYSRETIYGDHD